MLSDRSYMRDNYSRQTTSVLTWLLCALVAGYVLQELLSFWVTTSAGETFNGVLGLSAGGIRGGAVWTLVTYALLHSSLLHLIGNALGIYFLGKELIQLWGQKRFLLLYICATVLGGLVWLTVHWSTNGVAVGSTAALMALLVAYACINPDQQITLLLFFVIPVTIKPKWVAAVVIVCDLFGFFFIELPARGGGVYYSTHLGGIIVGWLFYYLMHRREWRHPDGLTEIELPRWLRKSKQTPAPTANFKVNLTSREDLRVEVDRILDKINSEGFAALTADEKRLLDEAKDVLSRP